ncbi:MAG TPA: hypothetical protein VK949_00725 [Methylotenera sp.]|nr:hypothetical protein [Methylotenera sp.]
MTYRKPRLGNHLNKVSKALDGTGKFITDQHSSMNEHTYRKINIMSTQQEINFLLVSSSLSVRRVRSANKAHQRLVANGKEDGLMRKAYEWIIDYLIVTAELFWMMIRTVLMFFWMLIIRALLIFFFTAVIFYILYEIIVS